MPVDGDVDVAIVGWLKSCVGCAGKALLIVVLLFAVGNGTKVHDWGSLLQLVVRVPRASKFKT